MKRNGCNSAIRDIASSLANYRVWMMFGWLDIKLRYRRSLLGPFWITISIGVMIMALGLLYSQIFNQAISEYLPYVGCSLILWFFISNMINEGCFTFISSEYQIKQVDQPLPLYAFRLLWRNVIIFMHNFIVTLLLLLIFNAYHWQAMIFPLTFLLNCAIFFFLSIILGFICARYRDVPQIVLSITQILIFITPIFWRKEFIVKHEWITHFNPAFHLLEIMRCPLLGKPFPYESLYVSLGMLAFMALITMALLTKYRNRLAYWV